MATGILGRSDFNVGQDISVTIKSSNGQTWTAEQLGHLTDIEVDRDAKVVSVAACTRGGRTAKMGIPQGYKGKLSFARMDGTLASALLAADKLWFESKVLTTFSIQYVVQNRDGSTNSYLASDAVVPGGKLFNGKQDTHVDTDFPWEAPYFDET
ncbi:MAG TPA: hypothetical protein V6C76_11750 [Drouetiella sp.]